MKRLLFLIALVAVAFPLRAKSLLGMHQPGSGPLLENSGGRVPSSVWDVVTRVHSQGCGRNGRILNKIDSGMFCSIF